MSECVKVIVRVRPMNKKEINNGSKQCVSIHKKINQVQLSSIANEPEKNFTYDAVYDVDSTQH
jgi:hypothetical protein